MRTAFCKFKLALLVFTVICLKANAQAPFDCINAIEVCNYNPINIQFENADGTVSEEIEDFCMTTTQLSLIDTNTVWLKYQFVSSGIFSFQITPSIWSTDIDFVVFRSETNTCNDLKSVRCMFSGQTIGEPLDSSCLGTTGLATWATDTIEYAGCNPGDDNFLATLEVEEGEVIYLAILSLWTDPDYLLEHGGTAEISCLPIHSKEEKIPTIQVFPNPSTKQIRIELQKREGKEIQFELLNSMGKKVLSGKFIDSSDINIEEIPPGMYFLRMLVNRSELSVIKLIKSP